MSAEFKLHLGDCIASMRAMLDASVDSIVTDPPYELGFMGKTWDASGIANSIEMWTEALRVLKPGGYLLAFSGSRTYHRMVCAIEDAGFEIRDQIMWVYGSGFPKSLDVSKAIDKAVGGVREKIPPKSVIGHQRNIGNRRPYMDDPNHMTDSDEPATDAARQWQGWGTALKPAHEPIVIARKPLIGTVAANVLAHGTGALNIDGCRVEGGIRPLVERDHQYRPENVNLPSGSRAVGVTTEGRWPANLIHDGSDEVLAAFPQAPGQMAKASTSDTQRAGQNVYGMMARGSNGAPPRAELDKSAARFFYTAKASKADRGEGNVHPTVKPTDLMAYLVRLVTPPGGTVLDPFAGSGSTGKACMREGVNFIGCELSPEYLAIARARIEHEQLLAAQRAYEALLKVAA